MFSKGQSTELDTRAVWLKQVLNYYSQKEKSTHVPLMLSYILNSW